MSEYKPSSEEQAKILQRMGSARVLDELSDKFAFNKSQVQVGDTSSSDRKNESWQERLARKDRDRLQAVEGAQKKSEVYSHYEAARLRKVLDQALAVVMDFEKKNSTLKIGSADYITAARKVVLEITKYLDASDVWSKKFTTMIGGGMTDTLELSDEDSKYYLTKSGLSMRLKRAALADGLSLKDVIQPIAELILFRNPQSGDGQEEYSRIPKIGWTTIDYITPEFGKYIGAKKQELDFQSPLVTFEKKGYIVAVAGPKDVWIHHGHRVNMIY